MTWQMTRIRLVMGTAALCAVLAACSAWRGVAQKKAGHGVLMNHALHAQEGLDCTDCHELTAGRRAAFPNHETCSICHDIPEDVTAAQSCTQCHTRPDNSVLPRVALLIEDIRFDHDTHVSADISCASCHRDPDKGGLVTNRVKSLCMDCHANPKTEFAALSGTPEISKVEFRANACAVCHTEISADTVPTSRAGTRIAHDSPRIWEKIHGVESHADPMFCAQCHDEQDDCAECHRVTKPETHTPAWSRKVHGMQAAWDRQKCSVCHEEDSCMKCHESTQPTSHRGSFDAPQNRHCVQCHFPPENSCAICHEAIDHNSTPPTPHGAGGGFPGACALCHPGGIPGTAPHLVNMTVNCRFCHQ